jgi:hypothetical protein
MPNDAEHLEALLAEYVDGQLDAASTKVVEDHLAKNPALRAAVEQMKLDREAVQALPRVTAPADLSEDLRGRLERDLLLNGGPIENARGRRFSPPMAAIAAMVMVGLGLAGLAYTLLGNRPKPYPDVALNDPASTPATSAKVAAPDAADAKQKSFVVGVNPSTDVAAKPAPSQAMNDRASDLLVAPVAEASRAATITPAEKVEMPSGPMAAIDAGISPGSGSARNEAAGGTAIVPPFAKGDAAPTPAEPVLAVSNEMLPADAAAAIVGRALDPARRSIVVVVDAAHALDAFAFASRFTKFDENALEVTDAGQRLTSLPRARAARERDALPEAELAVVARGLPESSASSIQSELRRVDANQTAAFEVKPPQATPIDDEQHKQLDTADTTRPATPSAGTPAFAPAMSQPTTMPTTAPAIGGPALIQNGERLRVTLTDPDAFDLRTQHEVTVDAAGNVALPSLNALQAAGKSSESLRLEIMDAYRNANLMRRPIVQVEPVDGMAAPSDRPQLIDLYVVVRQQAAPTSQPTSRPTTLRAE